MEPNLSRTRLVSWNPQPFSHLAQHRATHLASSPALSRFQGHILDQEPRPPVHQASVASGGGGTTLTIFVLQHVWHSSRILPADYHGGPSLPALGRLPLTRHSSVQGVHVRRDILHALRRSHGGWHRPAWLQVCACVCVCARASVCMNTDVVRSLQPLSQGARVRLPLRLIFAQQCLGMSAKSVHRCAIVNLSRVRGQVDSGPV